MEFEKRIEKIASLFSTDLTLVKTHSDIEPLRIKYLGKKGSISQLMEELKALSSSEKPRIGRLVNDLKQEINEKIETLAHSLAKKEQEAKLFQEKIDITLPGRRSFHGRRHVVLDLMDEALEILQQMGFTVQYGPDIDTDYYNFEALNFPKDHPAWDMQDTFYIAPGTLLRTHTSNTQVRIMASKSPPIRVVIPGKCYRNEEVSARSHVVFHQIEAVYIDEHVTFSDLLSWSNEFLTRFFKHEVKTRFRPSYFPFVEPGLEVDVECNVCSGRGCQLCKRTGWLEMYGAGMIHPEVMKYGGIDPGVYSGYAVGMGIERLAMMRYAIDDIRLFFENNLNFLEQF